VVAWLICRQAFGDEEYKHFLGEHAELKKVRLGKMGMVSSTHTVVHQDHTRN
jgi:hypothetical protein